MKLRLLGASLAIALLAMFIATPLYASAAPKAKTGAATLTDPTTGDVLGTVTKLAASHNTLTDTTTITGKFKDTAGNVTHFTTTLVGATGTCQILNLVLGPLSLNILGLQVNLNQVVLNITAQSGAGNLLGNLLCTVANLLNNNLLGGLLGILGNLTFLLNQIFGMLP
jgi:hypothetical protein